MPQCSVVVYASNECYYVFYREYLPIEWWVNESFVWKSEKSNEQIKKLGLRKEQEWLELVTELIEQMQ